jgi:protein phosphatase methylesterase 1
MDGIDELATSAMPPSSGAPVAGTGGKIAHSVGSQFDPLTWDMFFDQKEMIFGGKIPLYIAGDGSGHVYLCLHGAGHTAQSFAVMASKLKKDGTCISFDFRGHGENL